MGIDTSLQKDLQRSFDSLRPQMRSDFWSNPSLLMYGRQNTKSLNQSPESVFQAFRFNTVDSMDISDFEGANIIHDLNYPIPKNLEQKYNCVFDGGVIGTCF